MTRLNILKVNAILNNQEAHVQPNVNYINRVYRRTPLFIKGKQSTFSKLLSTDSLSTTSYNIHKQLRFAQLLALVESTEFDRWSCTSKSKPLLEDFLSYITVVPLPILRDTSYYLGGCKIQPFSMHSEVQELLCIYPTSSSTLFPLRINCLLLFL